MATDCMLITTLLGLCFPKMFLVLTILNHQYVLAANRISVGLLKDFCGPSYRARQLKTGVLRLTCSSITVLYCKIYMLLLPHARVCMRRSLD